MKKKETTRAKRWLLMTAVAVLTALFFCGCTLEEQGPAPNISIDNIPEFAGEPYVAVNGNEPFFTEDEITAESYEEYSSLDGLGRCGVATACVGLDIMPTEERGSIGQVKPSGWQTIRYDFVDGQYLYNRCHLIGYQLTGENANEQNLITGTRYMNVDGMLPFEDMIADYVKETGNHVMYRVTPLYDGDNLVASGVEMEAVSVEDDGAGIMFNVYVYNEQPGVTIDHETGLSYRTEDGAPAQEDEVAETYILNTSSHKFHKPDCSGVASMSEDNKRVYKGTREDVINWGYDPCGICNP